MGGSLRGPPFLKGFYTGFSKGGNFFVAGPQGVTPRRGNLSFAQYSSAVEKSSLGSGFLKRDS